MGSAASVSARATGSPSSGCAGTLRADLGKARAATRVLTTCFWGAWAPRRATTPRGRGWDNRWGNAVVCQRAGVRTGNRVRQGDTKGIVDGASVTGRAIYGT